MNLRAAVLLTAACLYAQPQLPSFEVASIKPIDRGFLILQPTRDGRRVRWEANPFQLVRYAFHLQNWRISGISLPDQVFAIDATAETAPTDDQLRGMFQRLLIDRFHLTFHWETRESPGFALVRGKGDPKIHAVADDAPPPALPEWLRGKEAIIPAIEGKTIMTAEGKGIVALTARRVTLAQIAEALQDPLGAFVRDQTDLAGKYYFGLKFAREDSTADPDTPSIYAAVQEQLGLKLEKIRGPVDVLVLDRIDRTPTEN